MPALRGEAAIAGTDKVLTYDMNALCAAEEVLGAKLPQIVGAADMGLTDVRALVWAGLQRRHKCTMDEAGDVISEAGIGPAVEAVRIALSAAMPETAEADPPKRKGRAIG